MEKFTTILLIDDDPITNFINQRLLKSMKIAQEIKVVTNGDEAIKCLVYHCLKTKKSPDVIFLDINMPVMDGFEFLEAYRAMQFENKEQVLIGALTTSAHPLDKIKMKDLGATEFLNKPLSRDKVLEFLNVHR